MNPPTVSVLIPAFNAGKYIEEALQSVVEQSYPNIEIIVVNDGSTDNTSSVLEKFENEALTVIEQKNQGKAVAANQAFQHSNGEFIKFFDADDVMSPNMIEKQVEALKSSPDHIALSEWGRFYGTDPKDARIDADASWNDLDPADWFIAAFSDGAGMMQCGSFLIPRSVLLRSGLWNESLSLIDDFEFFIRVLIASNGVRFSKGAALYYRSGIDESLSRQFSNEAAESAYTSIDLGTKALLDFDDSPGIRQACADTFQSWAYAFYPEHPELSLRSETRAKELGGSALKLPGGKMISLLSVAVGWRAASWTRQLLHALGWKYIAQMKTAKMRSGVAS